ncbi:glutamate 5-kinase [Planococcus lenghuensis]|uniref:Glutamate 5-kinase n=1 Tax=Planococcus lenghuensis TaxID=2213202 RepID=A0A1Q2L302_9BACL|nr:glutamate 5-kinase [Planococcus lenghuensis]AQQ54845.1 glutamate 5-kinase [Planococcus lenghuensis]
MAKKRIVVKIGSSSLTNASGGLSTAKLQEHVRALARLKEMGHEVILVSSGAVAAGFTGLGYPARPVTVAGRQAAAAVGQGLLMQSYTEEFKKHGIVAAQLLLTRQNVVSKELYNNVHTTLAELLKRNVLPVINENDSVSIEGLTFGDNDMLSALVSGSIHADFLIMLTDVNGIYGENPKTNPKAHKYSFLPDITDELIAAASGAGSKAGTGGMKSKVEAARTALRMGVPVFIGTGTGNDKLANVLEGNGDGTYIGNITEGMGMPVLKQWLTYHSVPAGRITVDPGAELALLQFGKSLLPVGITEIIGHFTVHDVVEVVNPEGKIIGKGQVNYSSDELAEIKGLTSVEAMAKTTGERRVVIHRERWVRQ